MDRVCLPNFSSSGSVAMARAQLLRAWLLARAQLLRAWLLARAQLLLRARSSSEPAAVGGHGAWPWPPSPSLAPFRPWSRPRHWLLSVLGPGPVLAPSDLVLAPSVAPSGPWFQVLNWFDYVDLTF
jgi:hypothetical protein